MSLLLLLRPAPWVNPGATGPVDQGRWVLEVCDRDGVVKGFLEPLSLRVTMRLNAAADLAATVMADSPGAATLDVYSRVVRAYRRPPGWDYGARIARFAGHVHSLVESGDADGWETVELVARDPFEAFIRRYQPWDSSYGPGTLDGAVAQLVGDANISAEDPGGLDVTYGHGLGVFTVGVGWPAGTWVWLRNMPMAEAFRALQEGEAGTAGFWWRVLAEEPVAGGIIGRMWIRALTPGNLKTGAPLEYGPGTRANVASYSIERLPPVNSVIALGTDGLSWKNDHELSGATYGLWPTLVSFPDETTTARLDALAQGVWQVYPADAIRLELAWPPDPAGTAPATPMLWDDFDVGDSLPVLIRGARRTLQGNAMVREATIEVDAEGTERMSAMVLELAGTS